MTIKEVEACTGMSRANIRFYENEGLVSPSRRENGYRDYSPKEVETLKKIRLLRELSLPLDSIRAAKTGAETLSALLAGQQKCLEKQTAELGSAQTVCARMCADGVNWSTLDPAPYLQALEGQNLPLQDVPSPVKAPLRRFLARVFDSLLYLALWRFFLWSCTGADLLSPSLLKFAGDILAVLGLTLLLEPLFLVLFCTTPGKALLGLSVLAPEETRLCWKTAFLRTFWVLLRGMGLGLPVVRLVCLFKSWRACRLGHTLFWENRTRLNLRRVSVGRYFAAAVLAPAMAFLIVLLSLEQAVPDHYGELTVAQFAQNYNGLARLFRFPESMLLDENGLRMGTAEPVLLFAGSQPVDYQYETENGLLKEVSFTVRYEGQKTVDSALSERVLAVDAFVWPRRMDAPKNQSHSITGRLKNQPFENWSLEANGVRITNQAELVNAQPQPGNGLVRLEGADARFILTFTMQVIKTD